MTDIVALKGTLKQMEPQFKAALPSHVKSEKFTRVLMTAVSNNPKLGDASRPSLLGACMKLAEMGLLPDGKEAAIVMFKNQCQPMPMVSGLMKLIRNSGELASLSANPVYTNDEFNYEINNKDGEVLVHKPQLRGDRGEFELVYAMATTKDGGVYVEVMSKEEVEKVRASSRSKDGGPWKTWYEQMAVKSVIRRLYKKLPSSTDLDTAVYADDDLYDLDQDPVVTAPAEPVDVTPKNKKAPSKLQAAMDDDDDKVAADEEIPI
jgi:recombination protein RecT